MRPGPAKHGWFVTGLLNLAAYCSLIVLVAGYLTRVPAWMVAGTVVGVVGMVCGFVLLGRSLPTHVAISAGLAVLAADVATVGLMWALT
jgi:hypothetical protein